MMAGTPDLSRVISLIMQNPQLIEEISGLAQADSATTEREAAPSTDPIYPKTTETAAAAMIPQTSGNRRDQRVKLLGAMKAYLSPERAKAVDTMMNILDILEITGGKS